MEKNTNNHLKKPGPAYAPHATLRDSSCTLQAPNIINYVWFHTTRFCTVPVGGHRVGSVMTMTLASYSLYDSKKIRDSLPHS